MKIQEIRKLADEQLEVELKKFQKELGEVSKEIREGKEKDVKKSLRIKRTIARIHTVLNEKGKNNLKEIKNGKKEGIK